MCGILYYQGYNDLSVNNIKQAIKTLDLRGPDNNNYYEINKTKHMGFARLSINDISEFGGFSSLR